MQNAACSDYLRLSFDDAEHGCYSRTTKISIKWILHFVLFLFTSAHERRMERSGRANPADPQAGG